MEIQRNVELAEFNSFAVACRAAAFCEVTDEGALILALEYANSHSLPVLVLGGGTNVLLTGDYSGMVIHVAIPGIELTPDNGTVRVQAGAGENWHQLVINSLNNELYGIENLALIPGSVGAAPIQNIGAYGVELAQVFIELTAVEANSGERWTFDRERCRFGYRDSVFKHGRAGELIVTSVSLSLSRDASPETGYDALQEELVRRKAGPEPTPQQVAEAVMAIRRSKLPDPRELPNCGSFFKNPVINLGLLEAIAAKFGPPPRYPLAGAPDKTKIPAAWLLDKAGWKGYRRGAVGVHREQAVVVVNYGGATGSELLTLTRDMQKSVLDTFGITLEPEVRII